MTEFRSIRLRMQAEKNNIKGSSVGEEDGDDGDEEPVEKNRKWNTTN
jgi:hypothetical protein